MRKDLHRHGTGPQRRLHAGQVSDTNRSIPVKGLSGLGAVVSVGGGRLSSAWAELRGLDATSICRLWSSPGFAALPGKPFHWDDPAQDAHRVRIALARKPEAFRAGSR